MLNLSRTDASLACPNGWWDRVQTGLAGYYLSSLMVAIAVIFAFDLVQLCREHPGSQRRTDVVSSYAAWDGEWYVKIATQGYFYDTKRMSSVAFYPAYPGLAGAIIRATGVRAEWALLLVSHASLLGAFVLLSAYVRRRFPDAAPELGDYVLLAMGLFPTTFFLRMAYSESLFLLMLLLAMYGMERKWPVIVIALLAGFATATRAVGVALVAPLLIYLWQQTEVKWKVLPRAVMLVPVACWGLLAYMAYQQAAFGEPLAFIKTQVHWSTREPADWMEWAWSLATLEPIFAVYDPSSRVYWGRVPPRENPLFNLHFANPIYFLLAGGFVTLGAKMRWLSSKELVLSVLLLLIPYVTQGYRAGMASEARYAAVVFPAYIVMGNLLHRLPGPMAAAFAALSGLMLAAYSALFASWYWFY
jgi:hypothetical protein